MDGLIRHPGLLPNNLDVGILFGDLAGLEGSGPGGRIVKRDVLAAADAGDEMRAAVPPAARPSVSAAPAAGPAPEVLEPSSLAIPATPVSPAAAPLALTNADRRELVSGMRQTIARRLVESTQAIPHYHVSMVFPLDAMIELPSPLHSELAEPGVKLSSNELPVRA